MFAISFDLTVKETEKLHPKGTTGAYRDIERTLRQFGFERIQGSVFTCDSDSLTAIATAMVALKALPWFPSCVRDIRGFKVEHWSDFTNFMKEQ